VRFETFAVATAVVAFSACSAAATATKNPQITQSHAPTDAQQVVIYNYKFDPLTLTVPVGATVTWVNHDIAPHTATRRSFDEEPFDSGSLLATQIFRHQFRKPGTYDYLCTFHPGMRGLIVVQ
jgi:plastocyanin